MARKSVSAEKKGQTSIAKPPDLTDIQVEAIGRETGEPGWMVDMRREALETYRRMEMPSPQGESWRNSDLLYFPFADLALEALTLSGKPKRAPAFWLKPAAGRKTGGQLAFEDRAVHTAVLEEELARSGVIFAPISQAVRDHPGQVRSLLASVTAAADIFSVLASIIFDVGYVLHVPKGVRIKKPLHALLWSSGRGLRGSRLLINVEEGAEVSLLHECASPQRKEDAARLELVDLIVHRGATLRFFTTQAWGGNIVRIAHEKAVVHRNGRLIWGFAHCGARSTKVFSTLSLKEQGASAQWSGLSVLGGGQRADYDILQDHLAANSESDYLGKSILTDTAQSHVRGMVHVAPEAAGSDGYQGNRILILSDRAKAEAVPGLEILSDDVRCSHGVSIGGLDPEELFYIRSRGIGEKEARNLLMDGFLEGVLERIPEEEIRQRVHLAVSAKMKTMEAEYNPPAAVLQGSRPPDEQGANA